MKSKLLYSLRFAVPRLLLGLLGTGCSNGPIILLMSSAQLGLTAILFFLLLICYGTAFYLWSRRGSRALKEEPHALLAKIITRIMRLLTKQGFLIEEQGTTYLAEADRESALLPLQAASCTYRIALGPRAGQKVLSLQSVPSTDRPSAPELCTKLHGVSLHAAVRWGADQRKELEHLCRYITRPAIANERLKRNRAGDVVLQLKSAFKDGTTHIVMAPLEFMQRLAALVPRPRLHLIRFHGVLAPNAKLPVKSFPVR
jgi:hypothetical protein